MNNAANTDQIIAELVELNSGNIGWNDAASAITAAIDAWHEDEVLDLDQDHHIDAVLHTAQQLLP